MPPPPPHANYRPRVLFVDPYTDGHTTYIGWLHEAGMNATVVADGAQAINVARTEHPSVVVVDLSLGAPRTTPAPTPSRQQLRALELVDRIRRLPPPVPRVILVSPGSSCDSVFRLDTGEVPVLPKENARRLGAAITSEHAAYMQALQEPARG